MTEKKETDLSWWQILWRPSTRYSLAGLAIFFTLIGVILWGGFNWSMELTNIGVVHFDTEFHLSQISEIV